VRAVISAENGARDFGGRSHAAVFLDDRLNVVRRQYFEGSTPRRSREGVGILSHVERAVRSLPSPVVADRLGNGQDDVRFGEGAMQGRATVPAGAEANQLVRVVQIGTAFKIFRLQTSDVDQHLLRRRLAGERRNRGCARFACHWLRF